MDNEGKFFRGLAVALTVCLVIYGFGGLLALKVMIRAEQFIAHPVIARICLGLMIIGCILIIIESITAYIITWYHQRHPVH